MSRHYACLRRHQGLWHVIQKKWDIFISRSFLWYFTPVVSKTWTKDKIKTSNLLGTIWHHAANCDAIFIKKSFTQWITDSCILISLIYTTRGIKYFWLIVFRKKCSLKIRPNPLPIVTKSTLGSCFGQTWIYITCEKVDISYNFSA